MGLDDGSWMSSQSQLFEAGVHLRHGSLALQQMTSSTARLRMRDVR
jgi:hypothetical protein